MRVVEEIEFMFVTQQIKWHILVYALLDRKVFYDIHAHLIDKTKSAERMEEP